MRLKGNQDSDALLLLPTTVASFNDPKVVIQRIPRSDQDYYRLGIGVDLIQALKTLR
jgi:hypothetical protein